MLCVICVCVYVCVFPTNLSITFKSFFIFLIVLFFSSFFPSIYPFENFLFLPNICAHISWNFYF